MSSSKNWESVKTSLFAEGTLSVETGSVDVNGHQVYYREGKSTAFTQTKGTLLFLHGQSFKSQTWHDLGTLHFMASGGYRPVGIDLPGYGDTKLFNFDSPDEFLLAVKEALGMKDTPVIIISPSMSGRFSIPFLFSAPEALKGYLPVAPVNTSSYTCQEYTEVKVPTCIVYGENDKNLGTASMRDLSNIPDKEVHVLKGAGHAAYMNSPAEFHEILLKFSEKLFV